jgi:NAD(P)-dependent dehydrogenase (short-subunit alcohol dehydrogenase family)
MGDLGERAAIVTGGAQGIGRHFALALARAGAAVAIFDLEDASAAARAIAEDTGARCISVTGDVSNEGDVARAVEAVIAAFGRIDILVNNAAYMSAVPIVPHAELTVETWDRVMAVNLRGPFLMVKHVTPHMTRAGYGKIINIGSATANKGVPNLLAYVTSKGGVLGFTRALSREVGAGGICVNTLSPGLIESDGTLANPQHLAHQDRVISTRAIQRVEVPDDLVGALLFLAGPQSDFMTGQTLVVDGGSANV